MPEHETWGCLYLTRAHGDQILRNPGALRNLGQRVFTPMWATNVERLEEDVNNVYVTPPDYPYICKFDLVWEARDKLERLFVQSSGRSQMYILARKMMMTVPNSRIPVSIVLQVGKPSFDCADGMVAFAAHNLGGNLVGTYEFPTSRRVTVSMLKSEVKYDLDDYKPGSHQVSCVCATTCLVTNGCCS